MWVFPRNGAQKSASDLGAEKKKCCFFLLSCCSGLASVLLFLGLTIVWHIDHTYSFGGCLPFCHPNYRHDPTVLIKHFVHIEFCTQFGKCTVSAPCSSCPSWLLCGEERAISHKFHCPFAGMILAHSSAALVDTWEFGRHTQATAHVTGAVAGKNPAQRKMGGFWVKQTTVRPLLLAFLLRSSRRR